MASSAAAGFPDPLVERAHAALWPLAATPTAEVGDDWPAIWERLKGDFAKQGLTNVPSFAELSAARQRAALAYMEARRRADHCLLDCSAAHVALHRGGIEADLVERYAAAREAYEESVERFGATCMALALG